MRLCLSLLLAVGLVGCPSKTPTQDAKKSGAAGCVKVGENCQFAPGKLGTCVQRDDCTQGNCFDCQSQH